MATLMVDWQGYLADTLALLNEQSAAAFTPDLAALDALIESLSVGGTTAVPSLNIISPAADVVADSQPVLQWESFPGAATFQVLLLDDDAYPPVVILDETTSETSFAVTSPLAAGSYSWTVWAFDANDQLLAELTSSFVVAEE